MLQQTAASDGCTAHLRHQNRTTVQHFWFDVSRRQPMMRGGSNGTCSSHDVESSYVHQRNRNTSVFAINPAQDFMACYDSSKGPDVVRLFDWSSSDPSDSQSLAIRTRSCISRPTMPRKRSNDAHEQDTTRRSQRLLLGVPRRQRKVAAMMMMMTTTTTRQDPKVMANYPLVSLNTGESNVPALSGRNFVIAMGFQLICLAWLSMIPEVPLLAVLTTAIFLLGEEFNRRRCTRTCSYTSK